MHQITRHLFTLFLALGCLALQPVWAQLTPGLTVPFQPRVNYNRLLEPKSQIVSGAGQSLTAFNAYSETMGPDLQPVVYMTYMGIKGIKPEYLDKQFAKLKELPHYHVPQIGLSFTSDGHPELIYDTAVAAGVYDQQIIWLCEGLKKLNRPTYIRVGYEFNGPWNGYRAEPFKEAFKRIVGLIRKHAPKETAILWCFAVDSDNDDFMKFYPGDQYIDWWCIDLFSASHFGQPETKAFMDSARAHKFPVFIGESTPRRVSVQLAEESWRQWFVKYFEFIHEYPHLKGLSYINWNWEATPWPDWGDGRIEANEYVRRFYKQEMALPIYLKSQNEKQVRKALRSPGKAGQPSN